MGVAGKLYDVNLYIRLTTRLSFTLKLEGLLQEMSTRTTKAMDHNRWTSTGANGTPELAHNHKGLPQVVPGS